MSFASQSARKIFHLSTDASGSTLLALSWLASMPSVIDRRPKGVDTY
jgi:hypothetical protein